jgi:hypothetical protein
MVDVFKLALDNLANQAKDLLEEKVIHAIRCDVERETGNLPPRAAENLVSEEEIVHEEEANSAAAPLMESQESFPASGPSGPSEEALAALQEFRMSLRLAQESLQRITDTHNLPQMFGQL